MKTLSLILASFALVATTQAAVLFYDDFSYASGNIVTNSGGNWTNHSGTQGDSIVNSGKYEINQTRTDDVNRKLTNAGTFLYASFTVNFSSLPTTSNGTYFAHFKDETTFNFFARVYAVRTNTALGDTLRLGIANAGAAGAVANVIFPVDLATNQDYQVVVAIDSTTLGSAQLWVNPGSAGDTSVTASDFITNSPLPTLSAYAWRQTTTLGIMTVDKLLVGNTFAEVATNASSAPTFARNPLGVTNYSGNSADLTGLATATSIGTLAYQWLKNGAPVGGATSNVLSFSSLAGGDTGSYSLVASNSSGSVTSAVAYVDVNTTPTAPQITSQPVSATNFIGTTVSFSVTAGGTGPLSYQWRSNNVDIAGATASTLTLSAIVLSANASSYLVVVSNSAGTSNSAAAVLTVLPPVTTNIAYLRTLQDPTLWVPTNTTTLYHVIGKVRTYINYTSSSANHQFYMEDGTAGIVVFFGGGGNLGPLPNAGDIVDVVGPLGVFNHLLELNLTTSNPNHAVTVLSTNNPLPVGLEFNDFTLTNDIAQMEQIYEGALITVRNVSFRTTAGVAFAPGSTFSSGQTLGLFDENDNELLFFVNSQATSIIGKPIPSFAYQVTGALAQFLGSAQTTGLERGYEIIPDRYVDIVTNFPAPFTVSISLPSPNNPVLTWSNSPASTYTVYRADGDVSSFNFTNSGLNFPTGDATYSETNSTGAKFYYITSP